MNPTRGLSDYLTFKAELPDILIKTGLGKLVFLPAGTPPKNPAELLASDRMKELVTELKERYRERYIIFDSSPLLLAADTLSLADYMDGLIFVVQAARTSRKNVAQAYSHIKGYNILGAVFNDVPKHLSQNLYSPYYRTQSTETSTAFAVHGGVDEQGQ